VTGFADAVQRVLHFLEPIRRLVAAGISAGTTDSTGPPSSATARLVALVFTGMLVGLFAERNRALVADLRLGAERDHLTSLGNNRFFDTSLEGGGSSRAGASHCCSATWTG
jgi:hypothetical protein